MIRHPGTHPRHAALSGKGEVRAGFTLVEVLVVLGILAILIGLLLPVVERARSSGKSAACLANLHRIMMAFQAYAHDNKENLPDPSVAKESWESLLRDYVPSRETYHCLSDGGLYDKLRSSYDWRDTGNPKTTLAGRSLLDVRRLSAVVAYDALPDYHGAGRTNAVRADGSAENMSYQDHQNDLELPISP